MKQPTTTIAILRPESILKSSFKGRVQRDMTVTTQGTAKKTARVFLPLDRNLINKGA